MRIKEIKQNMIYWVDFYGQDICARDEIKKAKNKNELSKIIKDHIRFLQDQNIDAITHAENFMSKIGLHY